MGKKKKTSNNVKNNNVGTDWKSQLGQIKKQMIDEMPPEEKRRLEEMRKEKQRRQAEFNRMKSSIYYFLSGYKQNSGIFVNNFLRNRDYETYCKDKFHDFEFDISGMMPNLFDNEVLSWNMVSYLGKLEKMHCAYFPIDVDFIRVLISFYEALMLAPRTEMETILYRGCSTIERNGVDGVVSTSTDYKIAEQFSRGTILTIHVPAGVPCIDVRSIRPREQQRKDKENEIILPPCDYEILSEKTVKKSYHELNNFTGVTRHLEIAVQPRDLLDDFLKMMENLPEEYKQIAEVQGDNFLEAKMMLSEYIQKRNLKNEELARKRRK